MKMTIYLKYSTWENLLKLKKIVEKLRKITLYFKYSTKESSVYRRQIRRNTRGNKHKMWKKMLLPPDSLVVLADFTRLFGSTWWFQSIFHLVRLHWNRVFLERIVELEFCKLARSTRSMFLSRLAGSTRFFDLVRIHSLIPWILVLTSLTSTRTGLPWT